MFQTFWRNKNWYNSCESWKFELGHWTIKFHECIIIIFQKTDAWLLNTLEKYINQRNNTKICITKNIKSGIIGLFSPQREKKEESSKKLVL